MWWQHGMRRVESGDALKKKSVAGVRGRPPLESASARGRYHSAARRGARRRAHWIQRAREPHLQRGLVRHAQRHERASPSTLASAHGPWWHPTQGGARSRPVGGLPALPTLCRCSLPRVVSAAGRTAVSGTSLGALSCTLLWARARHARVLLTQEHQCRACRRQWPRRRGWRRVWAEQQFASGRGQRTWERRGARGGGGLSAEFADGGWGSSSSAGAGSRRSL